MLLLTHVTLAGASSLTSGGKTLTDLTETIEPHAILLAVASVVLSVILIVGCAAKKKQKAANDTNNSDTDVPITPNASYIPSEDMDNQEPVTYEEVDDQIHDMYNPDGQEILYHAVDQDAPSIPEYAQSIKSNAAAEEVYNISMADTRAPQRRHGSAESRDIYGNSESIFQNVKIDATQVELKEMLDSGQFGEVMAGVWTKPDGRKVPIAAKTIKGDVSEAGRKSFVDEATMMAQLVHKNVLGVLAVTERPLMLIMERVSERSLKAYIEQHGYTFESPIPFPTLVEFAKQTAFGMSYLAEHGIVHRDIAARNMLLNVESRTNFSVKVADFGLSKVTDSIFQTSVGNAKVPIPTRWTALEALYKGLWSSSSDVWSWAVMVWELTTHGQFPYTLVWEDKPTVTLVSQGMRLHQAPLLPDDVYHLLMKCWATKVERRPTFGQVAAQLQALSDKMLRYVPDKSVFDVIDRKNIEEVLKKENRRKSSTPATMHFFLPAAPIYVSAPPNVAEDSLYYKILSPEDEDPVFVPALSQFVSDLTDGQSGVSKYVRHDRAGKVETLTIGTDDLLPPAVHFVRHRGSGEPRLLYEPPTTKRRQPVAGNSPKGKEPKAGRSTADQNSKKDRQKLLSGKPKSRKPYKKYSKSPGHRMQELMGFTSLSAESSDEPLYVNQSTPAAPTLSASAATSTRQVKASYANEVTSTPALSIGEKLTVERWLNLGCVMREDAEEALHGTPMGSYVVRKKAYGAVESVITLYTGPSSNEFKHYRLIAQGPSPEQPVDMIDTVNGNMNFPNLWVLLAYYKSHVPGVKRALPVRLGKCVPPM